MNAAAPPKPAVILATPLNVEESRAQRLQRQQARFRDRGGIFVPTNRSTLLDILLGKASPLKKPRRSASASPSRTIEGNSLIPNEMSKPTLRRSPRKQSQKSADVATDEQPPDDPESEVNKPATSKTLRSRPQKKAKVPRKSKSKPKDQKAISVPEHSIVDANVKGTSHRSPAQKATKNMTDASESKVDDSEDDGSRAKLKPKCKRASKTKPQGEVSSAKGTSKTRGYKPTTATTSGAVTSSSQLKSTTKAGPIYSDLSEDEMPTKKTSTKKVKKFVAPLEKATSKASSAQKGKGRSNLNETALCQLPDIPEEEGNEDMALLTSSSNPVVVSSKAKKRSSASITQDSDSQPHWKRIKTIQPDVEPSVHKDSNLSDEAPLKISKKRRRNPEDSESGVQDGVDKSTKRKKRSGQSGSKRAPEIPVEEENAKSVAKKSSNKTKVTKPASDNVTTVEKRKENAKSKPSQGKVTYKSGPPKSVLQRIKDSLGAQVVDNEPDPIDFLS